MQGFEVGKDEPGKGVLFINLNKLESSNDLSEAEAREIARRPDYQGTLLMPVGVECPYDVVVQQPDGTVVTLKAGFSLLSWLGVEMVGYSHLGATRLGDQPFFKLRSRSFHPRKENYELANKGSREEG